MNSAAQNNQHRIADTCPICQTPCNFPLQGNEYEVPCPRCGKFRIFAEGYEYCQGLNPKPRQRAIASGLTREREQETDTPFDKAKLQEFFLAKDISVLEKADRLLLNLAKMYPSAGTQVSLGLPPKGGKYLQEWQIIRREITYSLIGKCWALEWYELEGLCRLLAGMDRLLTGKLNENGRNSEVTNISIRPEGWRRIEELYQQNPDSQQGFVAMWFDPKMDHIYKDCIKLAIEDAGYQPHRVDEKEHAGKIDDEIIRQIRRSRFIVADATGSRGGVYYEAGFAHGLGLPVFLTCKEGEELHFDVRQYNCIFWHDNDLPQFRKALAARIEAVLGRGKVSA